MLTPFSRQPMVLALVAVIGTVIVWPILPTVGFWLPSDSRGGDELTLKEAVAVAVCSSASAALTASVWLPLERPVRSIGLAQLESALQPSPLIAGS
ncbi:MAG: hypothetical protein ACYCXW_05140 [Solirubrobacteraceae bacterium]